jgi:Skp family chaperone for outer membrane proteins
MKRTLHAAAAVILAASLVVSHAQTSGTTAPAKKHAPARKPAAPPAPSVQDQIQALRTEMQTQIDSLRNDLSTKDAQLRQAQQDAADARAAANKAEADAQAQQQSFTENASAVSTLQSTVTDLKANALSLATTVSDETTAIKKSINNPDMLHYKGATITPGGFTAGETVWRSKGTGGDIPTGFSSIPYEGADEYSLSEFQATARQSRFSMMVQGKTPSFTLKGYFEGDWLGTGITSNNNQSNSYVFRQRVIWGQAETNDHWAFTGGQLWSLATEDKVGISNLSGDIMTPQTIDPNYSAGFVWTRQYGFRITKTNAHTAFGVAVEEPQLLYTGTLAGNTPYGILGTPGLNGGNYNAAVSAVSATTYIQNYTNENTSGSGSTTNTDAYIPVYNTITANTNIFNLAFNQAPDIIVKAAFDPGWGHFEIIGIASFAHQLVFPGVTTNSVKYGGIKDIYGFNGAAPGTAVVASSTTAGNYTDRIDLGGFAASARVPLGKFATFGVKGLYGAGVGRYGDTTLSDVTNDANGNLAPLHNLSGLFTLEANPTPKLALYLNYGGDYVGRADFATPALTLGSPVAEFCETGVTAATASTLCSTAPTAAMLAAGGSWGAHWTTNPALLTAVGYGSRYASVSATCTTVATPGYQSGSAEFLPGGSGCGNNSRDVQEATAGWWFDIYRGDRGRFRQGFQYSYAVREGWSGSSSASSGTISNPAIGAKGIDNMFFTSLRYYIP